MYVSLSSQSSGALQSTAYVDDTLWSTQGGNIQALANQNGLDVDVTTTGQPDRNVYTWGDARAWILTVAQWDSAAAPGWRAAASGQDVMVGTGQYIAAVASVGKSMTKATVLAHLPSGVDLLEYHQQGDPDAPGLGPDPDTARKYIAVIVHARSWSGTVAWSKSILWSNLYTLVSAWLAPAASSPPASPPFPSPRRVTSEWGVGPWLLGAAALGGLGYGVWRWRKGRLQPRRLRA